MSSVDRPGGPTHRPVGLTPSLNPEISPVGRYARLGLGVRQPHLHAGRARRACWVPPRGVQLPHWWQPGRGASHGREDWFWLRSREGHVKITRRRRPVSACGVGVGCQEYPECPVPGWVGSHHRSHSRRLCMRADHFRDHFVPVWGCGTHTKSAPGIGVTPVITGPPDATGTSTRCGPDPEDFIFREDLMELYDEKFSPGKNSSGSWCPYGWYDRDVPRVAGGRPNGRPRIGRYARNVAPPWRVQAGRLA